MAAATPESGRTRTPTAIHPFVPYVHSGGRGRVALLVPIGLLTAALGGAAYGVAQAQSLCVGSEPKLALAWLAGRLGLAFAFALLLGVPIGLTGKWLHVRHPGLLRWYGALTGATAIGCAWIAYCRGLADWFEPRHTNVALSHLLADPRGLLFAMGTLLQDGVHTMVVGPNPGDVLVARGAELAGAWAIELLLVVFVAARAASRRIFERGYCETCNRWMEGAEPLHFTGDASPRDIRRKGFAALQQPAPVRPLEPCTRIRRQACPQCGCGLFTVEHVARYSHQSGVRGVVGHDPLLHVLLAPLLSPRAEHSVDVAVPWSWAGAGEIAALQRIATAVEAG